LLSNLDFLEQGKPFPPNDPDTQKRFRMYDINKELFHGEHGKVGGIFDADLKRLGRVVGNYDEVVDFVTLLNYHKLVSLKTADMVFGEKPLITCEDNKETLEQIEENTHMFAKFYQNVIDISRYGNGIFYIYEDENKGDFDVGQPRMWIPIVDKMNNKKVVNHVIAWVSEVNDKLYLNVQIHYKGSIEKRQYELGESGVGELGKLVTDIHGRTLVQVEQSSYTIGRLLSTEVVQTGLTDFAIQVTSNVVTSDTLTGIDDYTDINSLICELMVRVGQVSKILDKHSSPSVNAPNSAADQDPKTGEWTLKMGNVFFRDSNDDPPMEYITWDAQLEANFKQIELLLNQLYVLSEMGATLLGGEDKGGANTSGRALKFKMISPLAKVKRITMMIDPVIKNTIKLISQLGGENINDLTNEKITIKWQDGLPNDELEEAEVIEKRKNSGTMSTERALMQYDQMSEDEAQEEVDRINDEESQMNPLSEKPFSGDNLVGV
jgi:hypothetical protein